jgi:plasmid stabilization system protein ParE
MTVRNILEAELEILETVTFYKERARDIAADFFNEFKKAREEIKAFPEFWKDVGQGYRRKLIERYPFGIIYRIAGEEIHIVALAHTSRDPDYWRGR